MIENMLEAKWNDEHGNPLRVGPSDPLRDTTRLPRSTFRKTDASLMSTVAHNPALFISSKDRRPHAHETLLVHPSDYLRKRFVNRLAEDLMDRRCVGFLYRLAVIEAEKPASTKEFGMERPFPRQVRSGFFAVRRGTS